MRIPRIYTPQALDEDVSLALDSRAAHYLIHVLRAEPGSAVILFNGDGEDYRGRLMESGRHGTVVHIDGRTAAAAESPLRITLVQGIARGQRMDFSLQKAVELGVFRIVPVFCERTEVKLSKTRMPKRLAHWRGVIASACEQSGRARIPEIESPCTLSQWLERSATYRVLKLALAPDADKGLRSISAAREITLLVGPEGGLSDQELALAQRAGFAAISLGPRILRTETAGPAALAALQSLWGDLG